MKNLADISEFSRLMGNTNMSVFNTDASSTTTESRPKKGRKRNSLAKKLLRTAAMTMLLPMLTTGGVLHGARTGFWKTPYEAYKWAWKGNVPNVADKPLKNVIEGLHQKDQERPGTYDAFVDALQQHRTGKITAKQLRRNLDDLWEGVASDDDQSDTRSIPGVTNAGNRDGYELDKSMWSTDQNNNKRRILKDLLYKASSKGLGALEKGLGAASDVSSNLDQNLRKGLRNGLRGMVYLTDLVTHGVYGGTSSVLGNLSDRARMKREEMDARHDIGGDIIDVKSSNQAKKKR